MTIRWLGRLVIAAGALAFSTTSASALTLDITGGGMDATESYGCPTAAGTCSLANRDYSLESSSGVLGRIDVTVTGYEEAVLITFSVSAATFNGPGGPISFESVSYFANLRGQFVSTTPVGPGTGSINIASGPGFVTGEANDIPFRFDAPETIITCSYPGGAPGQCEISFGEVGFSNVLDHDWLHAFNFSVQVRPPPVTEPVTALMLALGFAGLALRARRS